MSNTIAKKLQNILEHPLVDTIANFIKKFKRSKSYWSVSFLVIVFTFHEAVAWKYGSAIGAYAQKQLEGSGYTWVWTAIKFVFDFGGSWELVLLGVGYFVILSYVKVNSAEKDEIVKVVKQETNKTLEGQEEIKELIKSLGMSENEFLEKYFGKDYNVILQNPQTFHNFTTLLKQTNKTADELLKEREELLEKIKSQSFTPKLQAQIDKAFKELRYEDTRELLDAFLEANADKEEEIIKAHYIKALTYMEQMYYDGARDEFEKIPLNIKDEHILHDNAELYYILSEYDKALEYQKKALSLILSRSGDNRSTIATNYENIGAIWHSKGIYEKSIEYYTKSLKLKMEIFGEVHPEVATSYNNMALLMHETGYLDDAMELYKKSLIILLDTLGEMDSRTAATYSNIGMILSDEGELNQAVECYNKALHITIMLFDDKHLEVAKIYNNLALTLKRKKEYGNAMEYYEKALGIQITFLGEDHYDVAVTYNNIGSVWYSENEYEKAIEYYIKAINIFKNIFPHGHPNIDGAEGNLESAKESLMQ